MAFIHTQIAVSKIQMIMMMTIMLHLAYSVSTEEIVNHLNRRDIQERRMKHTQGRIHSNHRPSAQMTRTKLSKTDFSAVVTAQTGSTAILHCNISNLNDSMENVTMAAAPRSIIRELFTFHFGKLHARWAWVSYSLINGRHLQLWNLNMTKCNLLRTAFKLIDPLHWIKWFKRNKISRDIITLMEETLIDDKRFLVVNEKEWKDWSLHIRYTQPKDAGLYQCQICTNFTSDSCNNVNITLKLKEAHAKILDGNMKIIPTDKYLPLRLSCILINSIEPPEYIFWYHDDRMINYDLEDGATVREGRQGSELIFPKANQTHTGNYSCVPSNARLDSVMVYYGEKGELMRKGNGGEWHKKFHPHQVFNMLVLVSTFHLLR